MSGEIIVVGTVSDDPLASDVAAGMGQEADISDLMSIKSFANTEFCPRFLYDENDMTRIGRSLEGKTVVIVSSCSGEYTRNSRAMRTFLVARAARDNGASRVVLVEPDLFYSAQDRGPRPEHGRVEFTRTAADYKKFDGQPFSAALYAELLKTSGVDDVLTVHNHSTSVQELFMRQFRGNFFNISPAQLYAEYLANHEVFLHPEHQKGFVLCAPDKGAKHLASEVYTYLDAHAKHMLLPMQPSLLLMDKERSGERKVVIKAHQDSPTRLEDISGREVVVFDDMVRTGNTIVECCRSLKEAGASRVIFVVTHFYSSPEVKENLNDTAIDDIITTNTLPSILNRDMQGRLRRKMLILKIERLIVNTLYRDVLKIGKPRFSRQYTIDISRKNPRWRNTLDLQD
ncbi:MAG: ribose-phosphate pyrophosphokinase-like domain-containing protein [Lentisphaeria bacterium]|nr:ribose-phosphate pyrophosphokinase-like domain-containing protein [Lentisphaeria bacterium]